MQTQSFAELFQQSLAPHPKFLAIGKNYQEHVKEMGGTEDPKEPVIFTKPFTSIYIAHQHGHKYPLPSLGRDVHHEIELGVLIGKKGKNISAQDAMAHVGGYFLGLDMTDREKQWELKKAGLPFDLSKGQDNFFPISEFIPLERVRDPHDLVLSLLINGKTVQKGSTGGMIHRIPAIIAFASQYFTLNPGDLILTGTPHGVGPVAAGDIVLAQVFQGEEELANISFTVG